MPLLSPSAARAFSLHGTEFHSYAASASGAATLAAWRADFAPQTPGTPHRMDREEILLILAGELAVQIDEERFVAATGDAVLVPAHARFRVSNDTDEPAALWATTTLGMSATVEGAPEPLRPPWAQ